MELRFVALIPGSGTPGFMGCELWVQTPCPCCGVCRCKVFPGSTEWMDIGRRGSATALSSTIPTFPKAFVQSVALKWSQAVLCFMRSCLSVSPLSAELSIRVHRAKVSSRHHISPFFPSFPPGFPQRCLRLSSTGRARDGIVLLCSGLGQPQLQCWGSSGHLDKKKT